MVTTPDSSIKFRFGPLVPVTPRPKAEKRAESRTDREELLPPTRRGFQVIPTIEVLEKLIDRAVEALKAGIYWDRGSILNVLV